MMMAFLYLIVSNFHSRLSDDEGIDQTSGTSVRDNLISIFGSRVLQSMKEINEKNDKFS
jgi:hypothetical protein